MSHGCSYDYATVVIYINIYISIDQNDLSIAYQAGTNWQLTYLYVVHTFIYRMYIFFFFVMYMYMYNLEWYCIIKHEASHGTCT